MAGPLSGIAGQQQVPLTQPSQTSNQNTNGVRGQNEERQPEVGRVQPQGAPAAETQTSESNNQDVLQQQIDQAIAGSRNELSGAEAPRRGSLVDVVV
ncbi:MAG: hypothetical protein H6861_00110 [Rhodospirillales bacterium]|nr:hypothetical protein [Rhodospirillales bacterium]